MDDFKAAYPALQSVFYDPDSPDLSATLDEADLVIVHEWNDPALVARLGDFRRRSRRFRLLFHDTHHRSATDPAAMAAYDLSNYDGVLAYGETIRKIYLAHQWARRAWTWHEAADVRIFRPLQAEQEGDLVWVGNWGDDERTAELREFLLDPVRESGIKADVYGVRYPKKALQALGKADMRYKGWLPNFRAPEVFARFRVTVHIPRRPYVERLPGIPTIRPFEALACGIPLICSPWEDREELFRPGDYLVARDKREMKEHLWAVLNDPGFADDLARRGRQTILERHTCGHRVDQLMRICEEIGVCTASTAPAC